MVYFLFVGEILKYIESFEWKGIGMVYFRLVRKDVWVMFC